MSAMARRSRRSAMSSLFALILIALFAAAAGKGDQGGRELELSARGQVKAPVAAVWKLFADVGHWADWNPAVKEVKIVKGQPPAEGAVVSLLPVINGKSPAEPLSLEITMSVPDHTLQFDGRPNPRLFLMLGLNLWEREGNTDIEFGQFIAGPGMSDYVKEYGKENLKQFGEAWVKAIKDKLEGTKPENTSPSN